MKQKSIFNFAKDRKPAGSTANILAKFRSMYKTNGNPLSALRERGALSFSLEGADDSTRALAEDSMQRLESDLTNIVAEDVQENGVEYTESQQRAAIMAAAAANGRSELVRALDDTGAKPGEEVIGTGGGIPIDGGEGDVGRMKEALEAWSMESYDEQENRNTMMFSFTYNLKAARQNEFGEALFPTVVLAPDVASITISVDLLSVQEEVQRNTDGTFDFNFHRKSLVLAIVDSTILNNDTTKVYPIVRDTDPTNLKNFVDATDIAPIDVIIENGQSVKTAPLKTGATFDLIGLSQPDYLIQQGPMDFTDQLDTSIRLETIYIKLKNGDIFKYDHLEIMPEAQFTYQVQGRNRSMALNFEFRHAKFSATTTKHDGSALTANEVTTNNYTAVLELRMFGSVNTDDGKTYVQDGGVTVNAIFDSSNKKLDLTTGSGQTAAQVFEDAKIIAYDIDARRINTNRRERGQILDLNRDRMLYSIPILAPVSIVRPATEDESSYAARIDSLITTTYIRCSNAAVTTLLSAERVLSNLPPVLEPQLVYNSQTLGAARFFVTPHFDKVTLDVFEQLQTLKSSDRIIDVNAVLMNHIREMVFKTYLLSNYKAARDVLQGDLGDKKPLVIIATDPVIAAYLQIIGDTRNLGDQFDFKVVSTPDYRMRDKIIMVFGKENANANDVCNPLHFGNMYWRPELTSILPISRNNTISRELTVQPSFRHIVHCPVMMSIEVKNLEKAVKVMAPITTKQVP